MSGNLVGDLSISDQLRQILKADDFEKSLSSAIGGLDDNKLNAMRQELTPYGTTLSVPKRYVTLSHTSLGTRYQRRLAFTSLAGFLYRVLGEWQPEGTSLDDAKKEQAIIKKFLDNWLEYNPDLHVRSAHVPNERDPERRAVDSKNTGFKSPFPPKELIVETVDISGENRVVKSITPGQVAGADMRPLNESSWHAIPIPPADTFHRWEYYHDVNYEKLREFTWDLYHDKPDLEDTFNVFRVHETPEEAKQFVEVNVDGIRTSILTVETGKWNLIGPFKKNRERIDFYTKETEVLKMIHEQNQKDAELGRKLMERRTKEVKKKNVKECGPDAPGLAQQYQQSIGELPGAVRGTTYEEQLRWADENKTSTIDELAKKDMEECPDDSIPVPLYVVDGNEMKRTVIYTKADKPEDVVISDGGGKTNKDKTSIQNVV